MARLLPVLAFRNQLPQIVVDELEQLVASINVVLETQFGDTSDLQAIVDDLQDAIDLINATRTHNLLSTRHPDTIPDSPTPGALVVGTPQAIETDLSSYWLEGHEIPLVPSSIDPGDETYWLDGLPIPGMLGGLNADVKWEKVDKGEPGQVWTATPEGAEWQDSGVGGSQAGVHAYVSTDQAIASATETILTFSAVADDSGPFWSSTTNPSRLTAPVAGTYVVVGQARWADALGVFAMRVLVNGSQRSENVYSNQVSPSFDSSRQVTDRLVLNEGDYVQFAVYWSYSDAVPRTIKGGTHSTFLKLVKV